MTKRLILSYLAISIVVLVMLEVPFAIFFARQELDRLTADVERDASVVATLYEDSLESNFAPDPRKAESYAAATGTRVVVVDNRGISIVDTDQPTSRDFSNRPEFKSALAGIRAAGTRSSATLDTDLLYVALPIASGGTVHGAIRITLDTSKADSRVRRFWWGLGAIAVVVLSAITLVGWLIARSVTQPLHQLNDTARRFGSGDLTVEPSESRGPPELRELASSMGTMASQLASMIEQQRSFVADASHQLRTPLTGLKLRLENLQAKLDSENAAEIELAMDEISRLSTLVNDLLRLARTDRHESPTPQDLMTIVRDRLDTWSAVADGSEISLVLEGGPPGLRVLAVPGAIEQILDNVLDNAIGIAPPGSTVTVRLEPGEFRHCMSITDQGPGLDDEDKTRALSRFWRGDNRRPGTGLGLAIADALARASGGKLTLRDGPTGGLRVDIELGIATNK